MRRGQGMTIKISEEYTGFDTKVAAIDAWYDRHTRLWVVQKLNKDGFQIGDAEIVYGKAMAMKVKEELKAEYSV